VEPKLAGAARIVLAVPRWLLKIFLLRPVVGLARAVSRRLDALLAADFQARFVDGKPDRERLARLEESMGRVLRTGSALEKQELFGWVEDRAIQDQHTVAYAENVFEWQRGSIVAHKGTLEGLRILELGPGHSIVPGLLLYAHGAQSYMGADYFPIAGKASSLYRRTRDHLARRPVLVPHPDLEKARERALARFDEAVTLSGEEAVFKAGLVEWRHPVDAASLPFPDASFDVVISNAAFEHFLDPVAAAREQARVLAKGGVGIHQVDLRDHRDFSKPLDFLRYEKNEWRRLNADMVCYTNRVRRKDLEKAFSETGLAVEVAQPTETAPVAPDVRSQFHAEFRDRDDLETLGVFFVLRKR